MPTLELPAVCDFSITNICNAARDFCSFARDKTLIGPARYVGLCRVRVNAERLPTPGSSASGPCSSRCGTGRGAGRATPSHPSRRRYLDRAGSAYPRFPPLRRVARSPDQCRGSIIRLRNACARDGTDRESRADAGRQLLGKCTGKNVGIKTRAPLDGYWQVFGGHGQRDL